MDKLDQLFKNAMDSQAEPYDPAAWESLSKRLDKQLPPKSNPFKKWGPTGRRFSDWNLSCYMVFYGFFQACICSYFS